MQRAEWSRAEREREERELVVHYFEKVKKLKIFYYYRIIIFGVKNYSSCSTVLTLLLKCKSKCK